jgi:hypothetical protein
MDKLSLTVEMDVVLGTGATTTPCEYMFPGTTDPKFSTPWTMVTASIQPTDMRWLQSAGIFTLTSLELLTTLQQVLYGDVLLQVVL